MRAIHHGPDLYCAWTWPHRLAEHIHHRKRKNCESSQYWAAGCRGSDRGPGKQLHRVGGKVGQGRRYSSVQGAKTEAVPTVVAPATRPSSLRPQSLKQTRHMRRQHQGETASEDQYSDTVRGLLKDQAARTRQAAVAARGRAPHGHTLRDDLPFGSACASVARGNSSWQHPEALGWPGEVKVNGGGAVLCAR